MTWRIAITPDAIIDGISIQIARRLNGPGSHAELLTFAQSAEIVEPGTMNPRPSLAISDDLGRALLDALAAHFGGTTGGQQQRADFEHERARVDRLIGHLTSERKP